MNIANTIELYIKELLEESGENYIVLGRNELAQNFNCAPSQINYVLQTRFNVERGYITESQRGGGGYIRIIRLDLTKVDSLLPVLDQLGRSGASQRQALDLICWLQEQSVVSAREAGIMAAVMDRSVLDLEMHIRDGLRSRMLAAMVEAIIKEG